MKRTINCLSCIHLQPKVYHAHWNRTRTGYREFIPKFDGYYCPKKLSYLRTLKRRCRSYTYIHQTKIIDGDKPMVKLDDIPTEKGRIELADLPQFVDLKAVEEKMVEATTGKSGGLIITFELRDGRQFPQKYTKVSGAELSKAMDNLGLKDTEDLQKAWYNYKLSIMRIGLPRMIPVKKAKEQ